MATAMTADPLMNIADTAVYLGIAKQTLYRWRHEGKGPRAVRVGGSVRYRRGDLDAWIEENFESTPGRA